MLNNSGTYGPNEVRNDMVAPINSSQSNSSTFSHNLIGLSKIAQETPSSSSGDYDPQNYSSLGQPHINLSSQMYPYHAYQGHLSSYLSPNSFNQGNAIQDFCTAVSNIPQPENLNNMLHCQQKFAINCEEISEKESTVKNNYPLNIPQIPTRIYKKSSNLKNNDFNNTCSPTKVPANIAPSPIGIFQKVFSCYKSNIDNLTSLSENTMTSSNNMGEKSPNSVEENYLDKPENLSQNRLHISPNPTKVASNDYNNPSAHNKDTDSVNYSQTSPVRTSCLSERKRKSLENTVRLIESILIQSTNNNTKPDTTVENSASEDPLALSPNLSSASHSGNDSLTDSDDEALINKVAKRKSRNMRSPSKKIESTRRSHVIEHETKVQFRRRMESETLEEVVVKIEDTSSPERDSVNPFLRDYNGVQRSNVDNMIVVSKDNSVEEAAKNIKNGASTATYYECPYCSILLAHPKRFLIHAKWHTFGLYNEKRAEMAKERADMIKERRIAKSNQRLIETEATGDEERKSFPCKDCDKIFATKSSLKGHRRKFHLSEPQECKICRATVQGHQGLREHMTIHEDKTMGGHQCPECSKRFKFRHSLAKHIGTHLEKTHGCSECSKMFGSEQLLKLHMKTHERMARGTTYHCSYCGKGFYEPYNLNVHERTHRNDKPFKCDTCGSCFVTNSSLKRHLKVSHSGAKPFVCQTCQKCFSTESIRDRHELRVHSDQGQFPHPCHLCPRRYMKTKDLRNHMYKMHPKVKKETVTFEVEPMSP